MPVFENAAKLGFGLMRLPEKNGKIDMELLCEMTDEFLRRGYTYFDTAHMYCDGEAERCVPEILSKRYPRSRYLFATKLSSPNFENRDDMQRVFETQLESTQVGYFDNYLLHSMGGTRTEKYENTGAWDFVAGKKAEGLVKHIGFSFHDTADKLDEILTRHPEAEFVQLQVNYADYESPSVQSRLCCEVANKHGKPIIVMEPVKGGCLAGMGEDIRAMLAAADPNASVASWAVRFAAGLKGVKMVLSGMSTLEQVMDNTAIMDGFKPLSEEELKLLGRVNEMLKSVKTIPCTKCKYCVSACPQSINVPGIITTLNNYDIYRSIQRESNHYKYAVGDGVKASECLQCGLCEAQCPQKIGIIAALHRAAELFEG